jgi:hypothetical protein
MNENCPFQLPFEEWVNPAIKALLVFDAVLLGIVLGSFLV